MIRSFRPPYLGAAYYPEDWDESQQDYDLAMMKKVGINVVRIAEFAWKRMEPRPGEFDFSWLHRIIRRLADEGIATVLCTPSATPPRWLSMLYPDVTLETENGRKMSHGGRRHCCSNNAHYREASARIVEAMAKEFGSEPTIIGWQIDNEIYAHDNNSCFCETCTEKFHEYLHKKFGSIEALNAAWNLNLWSQAYDSFDEIPAPRDGWHNPHLRMEWKIFQNESHVDFVHMQAKILRRHTKALLGTDVMPFHGMNYRRLNEELDVVQFNHYNRSDNLWKAAMWFDYFRTLRPHPFWCTETQTCWSASVAVSKNQTVKPEGFCRVNSFLPLALGGEANMYWLWRTHWAGHELMHGSVLDASGRPMHIFGEVQDVSDMMAKAADFLNGTRVATQIGVHFTSLNWNMVQTQSVVTDLQYAAVVEECYKPLIDAGLRPDLIDAEETLDKYRLIFSPMMMTLEEGGLPERIEEWVKNGGVWVVGPLSDIRTEYGTRYQDRAYGILEKLTGARWLYGIPDHDGRIQAQWTESGEPFGGKMWYDIFDESEENSAVKVTDGHSTIQGKACVLHRTVGKGHVILVGTLPAYAEWRKIDAWACDLAGLEHDVAEGEVLVSPRCGEVGEGVILTEYAGKTASYRLDGSATDLLTGERLSGTVELKPYEIRVLKK